LKKVEKKFGNCEFATYICIIKQNSLKQNFASMKKVFIKDELTQQYYGVQCESNPKGYLTSDADEGSPGPYDFSFWTADIEEAYNFGSELSATNEMKGCDLTEDGTRKPVIVEVN